MRVLVRWTCSSRRVNTWASLAPTWPSTVSTMMYRPSGHSLLLPSINISGVRLDEIERAPDQSDRSIAAFRQAANSKYDRPYMLFGAGDGCSTRSGGETPCVTYSGPCIVPGAVLVIQLAHE